MLEIGKIINTHGIRGEVKVQPWCDDSVIFDELEYIYADGEKFYIDKSRFHKNNVILKLQGIDTIDTAIALKNKILTVEREILGELEDGVYYVCDLIGLNVKTVEGELLGEIEEVIKTGSNDVYQLKGKHKKPLLIPALHNVILEVNIEERYMIVKLPEGLL